MPAFCPANVRFARLAMPEPNSGCWLWLGSVCADGYGKFNVAPETLAHRFSYVLHHGHIPTGTEVDHKCRVRSCVNPDHLQAISHASNVRRGDFKTNHRNRVKTHCKRGHPLAGNNLVVEVWRGLTMRKCRTCRADRQRARAALRMVA
jgi:hypothetical protein